MEGVLACSVLADSNNAFLPTRRLGLEGDEGEQGHISDRQTHKQASAVVDLAHA